MWIKALFCTQDSEYARRLDLYFESEYANKYEINICSSFDRALQLLEGVDMFLVGKEFEQEIEKNIRRISCPIVMMTDQLYENTIGGIVQIAKYQRADDIYIQLLDCYARVANAKALRTMTIQQGNQKVYIFTSANGGNGTSTVARAFAKKCSFYEKTLFLDLGMYSDLPIESGAKNGMDDVIFALKSRRHILPLKLSSSVARTSYGFFSYGTCMNPMHLLELNSNDIISLLKEINSLNEYTKVVVDLGNSFVERDLVLFNRADTIVFVLDERKVSTRKFKMFLTLLEALEKRENCKLLNKISVFKNMVSKDYNHESWPYAYPITGWAPIVSNTENEDDIIERIAASDSFSNLEM